MGHFKQYLIDNKTFLVLNNSLSLRVGSERVKKIIETDPSASKEIPYGDGWVVMAINLDKITKIEADILLASRYTKEQNG